MLANNNGLAVTRSTYNDVDNDDDDDDDDDDGDDDDSLVGLQKRLVDVGRA